MESRKRLLLQTSSLTPELITAVLSRLPVKSLLRFRCVSKAWCAEIDSPYFINLHLKISTTINSNLVLYSTKQVFSIDINSDISRIEFPFSGRFEICDSANSLLLLIAANGISPLVLFNPSTRKHLILPDCSLPSINKYRYEECYLFYDVMHDDYIVCRILHLRIGDRWIISEARFYSMNSNSWRIIKGIEEKAPYLMLKGCAYVNGALHSIYEITGSMDPERVVAVGICVLNIKTEAFCLLPLPKSNNEYKFSIKIDVYEGCLCVTKTIFLPEYYHSNEFWVMKDYGLKESWNMLYSIDMFNSTCAYPTFYSKSSHEVLMTQYHVDLIWHDLKTGRIRNFLPSFPPFYIPISLHVCAESLVSLESLQRRWDAKNEDEE